MYLSSITRRLLEAATLVVLTFLYAPILYVFLLSFNRSKSVIFSGFTLHWWPDAFGDGEVRTALWGSVKTATVATILALVLGSLASFAVHRFRFFGREAVSFAVILKSLFPASSPGLR